MFKKFSLWAAAMLFTLSVFGVITLGSLNILLQPDQIKLWGSSSDAYQKLPGVLIDQAAAEQSSGQTDVDALSFKEQGVQDAAKKALTPAFVQKSAEQFIDGNFAWLSKQSAQPNYTIDLLSVKQDFVDNLGVYLKDRYEALPFCASGELPRTSDLLKIDCRPDSDMFDVDQAIDNQKLSMLESKDFLPETTISAESLSSSDGNSVYSKTEVPEAYSLFRLAPMLLGGLAAICGILVATLCESKKFGIRKLGWRVMIAGILALLATVLGFLALAEVRSMALSQGAESGIAPYKDIVASLINVARNDLLKVSGVISGAAVLLGGIILLLTRSVSRKARKANKAAAARPLDPVGKTPPEPKEDEAITDSVVPTAPVLPAAPAKPKAPKHNLIQ